MRKIPCLLLMALALTISFSCNQFHKDSKAEEINNEGEEENEAYDGAAAAQQFEFEKTKDPATGHVPYDRLWVALDYTKALKANYAGRGVSLLWTERGPIYDSVGSNNGNGRGGGTGFTGGYTSGRIMAFMVDQSDATGNTVYCGGVAGGLWKCTNFLDTAPNWQSVNDYFSNMSISSICQDPTNTSIMYFTTGEPTSNIDAVLGNGIWKSVDHGVTWSRLSSTTSYTRSFKILCDNSGNVYAATRGSGLVRSTNGGTSWTTITPLGLSTTCTDIELSSTGKLHASFGLGSAVAYRYTTTPSTISTIGWNSGSGIFATSPRRFELATAGDILYGITTNSSDNIDYCYKSVDGGATWTQQNATAYTSFTSGQGWYDLTLSINPANTSEIMMGELDAYRSTNSGSSVTRATFWTGTGVFVHADHHLMEWTFAGGESRIIIASDGGLFYSNNGGSSFSDKNKNLSLKQFYSCSLHPTQLNYIYGGAQDNGCHLIKNAGLTYSIEVSGGDGAYVHIDQNNPQYFIGSYVYNQFKRSTNGGNTFSNFYFSSSTGLFINPWTYDDQQKIIYACGGTGTVFRWTNPTTATNTGDAATTNLTLSAAGTPTAFTVSPYTANRLYVGTSSGYITRLDNANTGTTANETILNSGSGYINCIAVGTSDNYLVATSSSYGVNQVRYSNDGGTTWTTIDGNLPDMPVRWAVFHPTDNNKILIATEAGVYTTLAVNGASTQWFPSPGFPLVRTDMLTLRASDNTVAAATHGRGMFTANIISVLPLHNVVLRGSLENENISVLSWTAYGATNNARYHLQYSTNGINFTEVSDVAYNVSGYRHPLTAPVGYYRVMAVEPNSAPVFSNVIVMKSKKPGSILQVSVNPNPVSGRANITITSPQDGEYSWKIIDMQGRIMEAGKGSLSAGNITYSIEVNKLIAGTYYMVVQQGSRKTTTAFIKQ